ncbi:MAG: hypothetical protein HQK49_20345 [Oligoflexia bacterium]|nr:hypothetical protein [Oligoflexia bacterium]
MRKNSRIYSDQFWTLTFACASACFYLFTVFAITSVFEVNAVENIKKTNTVSAVINTQNKSSNNKIVAYYFHGNARCRSCLQIEKLSKGTIDNKFTNELQKGIIEWRVVNIEEEKNQHYINDYKLYTKSVVLSLNKGGVEKNWKNLEKVWEYLRDEKKFETYVQSEVNNFLGELKL